MFFLSFHEGGRRPPLLKSCAGYYAVFDKGILTETKDPIGALLVVKFARQCNADFTRPPCSVKYAAGRDIIREKTGHLTGHFPPHFLFRSY